MFTPLEDLFAGTPGAALAGRTPDTHANGSDVWADVSGLPAWKVALDGASLTPSGSTGPNAFGSYPLTGVGPDQTATIVFRSVANSPTFELQLRRHNDPNYHIILLAFSYSASQVTVAKYISGSGTLVGSPGSFSFVNGTSYTVVVSLASSGGSTTVNVTINGTAVITGLVLSDTELQASGYLLTHVDGASAEQFYLESAKVTVASATAITVGGPSSMTVGSASGAYTATTDNGLPAQDGGILVQPASSNFTSTPSPTTVNLAAGQTTSPSWTMLAANVGSGSRTVGAAASGGINVTAKSVTVNPGSLAAGTATAGSVTTTTAAATATDASGGTTPYAYQWYRSTGSGTLGSAVSGQTTRTLADTGLSPSTAYYYTLRYADAASATVDSNQVAATTSASSASTGQLQAYHTTASLATVYFVIIKANGQAWNGTAFESLDSSHWATYAIAGSDAAGVKIYLAAMPSAIPAGWVTVATFIKAGGSAASTDTRFSGPERLYWDGTTLTPSAPGSFPSAAPDSWIHRASFAADAVQDGVMRATSTAGPPAVLHFSASDAKANALANGAVSQYIEILSGTGAGQVIPVATISGSSGTKDGTVQAGHAIAALGTDSAYQWTGAAMPPPDPMAAAGVLKTGETGYQSLRKLLAEATGQWDTTSVSGQVIYRLDGVEVFRCAVPTATGRAASVNGGGL
jgi:hypothetical protein